MTCRTIAILPILALLLVAGCVPLISDGAARPDPPGDLAVSITGPSSLPEGTTASLTATAASGTPPYAYRWIQNDGPADLDLQSSDTPAITASRFPEPGRYSFRVTATDATGATGRAFFAIDVRSVLDTDVPDLAVIGEPTPLRVDVADEVTEYAVAWQIISGDATIEIPDDEETALTVSAPETVNLRVRVIANAEPDLEATRDFEVVAVPSLSPRVTIETRFGAVTLELDGQVAPRHTAAFLRYVDDGFYDGLLFHRIACQSPTATDDCEFFVLQGGGYFRAESGDMELREPTRGTIPAEVNDVITNAMPYSVAMALRAVPGTSDFDVDSAATEFFINLADNAFLDEQGFTAFARVVDGTDVVDTITALDREQSPIITGEVSLPVEDVIMERVYRAPQP